MLFRLGGAGCLLLVVLVGARAADNTQSSCAVVGDSIALGAGKFLQACKIDAKNGISSAAVVARVDRTSDVNVISAGSNDPENPNLRANLDRIRSRARDVIWILPIDNRARSVVQEVAAAHGDPVVSFAPAGDRVHPRSEMALARSIVAVMGSRLHWADGRRP
jgi:hypothetical protein